MAVLCGSNGEVCYSKYGSYPLRGKYCHEMALRIVLACIESHANRYKRYIVPVLSVQMDFYVRVFVSSLHNTSVRYLPGFGPVVPQECSDCGKKYNMGGPIWSDPIHDQDWVSSILADVKAMKNRFPAFDKISAVLTTISEELPDVPLFLSLHNLCGTLKCTSRQQSYSDQAVINAGYRISGTHVNPFGIKNPMLLWMSFGISCVQSPDQSGSVILAKEPVLQVSCTSFEFFSTGLFLLFSDDLFLCFGRLILPRAVASLSKAQSKKVARFLPNPERHWGPKLRAGRTITSKHVSLLGADAVNGVLNNNEEEAEERQVKRQRQMIRLPFPEECNDQEPYAVFYLWMKLLYQNL
ncbi:putative tRNA (guanine(26)-N(2))-dimethyltransferase [Helianthus annuus]|nr:putative tRNA (guanine(26)-N(2))-dimethyltransferase [Helianthus annuus]